jgi:hypothetical protein
MATRPEGARVDARKFGNIGRNLAAVRPARHFVGDFVNDFGKVRHGFPSMQFAGIPAIQAICHLTMLLPCRTIQPAATIGS